MFKPGIFFRTHFWDDSTQRAQDRLGAVTQQEIVMCADETRGTLPSPDGLRRSSHGLERFRDRGLPLRSGNKILWHNGDYPLYTNAADTDVDPLIMVEYDVFVGVPLDPLIERMPERRLDFVAPKLGRRPPRWHWTAGAPSTLEMELALGASPHAAVPRIQGCLFPFISISRKATQYLLQRRQKLARALPLADQPWPFCEAFAPTEVHAAGLRSKPLGAFVDVGKVESRWPLHVSSIPQLRGGVAHPVLGGTAYLRTLLLAHEIRTRSDYQRHQALLAPLMSAEPPELVRATLGELKPKEAPTASPPKLSAIRQWLPWPRPPKPKPPAKKPGIFLRTHFWDETVQAAYERLRRATSHDIVICADETLGSIGVPPGYKLSSHSLARFSSMGLACKPKVNTLWHNGDYPLYSNAEDYDFDPLIMIEYDTYFGGDLDKLIARWLKLKIDFVAPRFSPRPEAWGWHESMKRAMEIDTASGASRPAKSPVVFGCLFPFVFVSRALSEHLRARRQHLTRLLASHPNMSWPFCEAFVATEVAASAFRGRALDNFINSKAVHHIKPTHVQNLPALGAAVAHPALQGGSYIRKLLASENVRTQAEFESRKADLLPRLANEPSEVVQSVVESMRAG